MPLELRLIRTFLAVIDHGTVVAASRVCGYSSAAISRQLQTIQQRLGVTLFERDGRSIRPTADALRFAAHARELIVAAEELDRHAGTLSAEQDETRVGGDRESQ